jgi:hypothetical protein
MPKSKKKLSDLSNSELRKLVGDYDGHDIIEYRKKIACKAKRHEPIDKKISTYVNLMIPPSKYTLKENTLLKETSEKIFHLYLRSVEDFPPDRDAITLACINLASKNSGPPYFTQMKISEVTGKNYETLSRYTKLIIKDIVPTYTTFEDIEKLIDLNFKKLKKYVFQIIDYIVKEYEGLIEPCDTPEIKKIDTSEYNEKINSFLNKRELLKKIRKDILKKSGNTLLTHHNNLKMQYKRLLNKYNFFEKPVTFWFKYETKSFDKLTQMGLIEYDSKEKSWKLKDVKLMEDIQILADNE